MIAKMDRFPANNPNPVLHVERDGTVLYSNEAGEPLLIEWGVEIGKKLPTSIVEFVQRVISRNSPEKMEVKVGERVYLVVFHPLHEQECVSISGFDISDHKEFEHEIRESKAWEMADLELAEIIDARAIQSLMDDFYELAHIPMSLDDLRGNILVGVGWQDICTKFHRVSPETCRHCVESDTKLSAGVQPGEFKLYKCKNNMWDIATPIMISGQHVGNIFSGQFFFEGEPLDFELFRSQARRYGFNEEEYMAALKKVPRLSRKAVDTGMSFFIKLANLISQLSYSNIKLAHSLAERDTLLEALHENEEKYRSIVETANEGIIIVDSEARATYINEKMAELLGYSREEMIGKSIFEFVNEKGKDILRLNLDQRRQGIHQVYELGFTRKDGSPLWALISAKAIFSKDGKFTGSLGMVTDITERKKVEDQLKETQENLEKLVQERTSELEKAYISLKESERGLAEAQRIAHIGNWDWNIVTNSLYWSDEIYIIFGRSPQEFGATYEAFLSYVHPDDREYVNNAVKEALNGKSYSIDHRIILANGEERIVHEKGEVIFDEKNNPTRMRGTVQDITERKKTEDMLRQNEERIRLAQQAAKIGAFEWNIQTGVNTWTPELEAIYGLRHGEFGKTHEAWEQLVHPEDKQNAKRTIDQAIQTGEPTTHEFRVIWSDGSVHWISGRWQVFKDKTGKPLRLTGVSIDITEQKRAEETILAKEAELQLIANNTPIMLNRLSSDQKYIYVNRAYAKMLDRTQEEIIGKPIVEIMGKEAFETIRPYVEKVLQGQRVEFETEIPYQGISPRFMYVIYIPERNVHGEVVGWFASISDITARRKAEEALAKLEIARKKEIHHRIKNNLQVISSLLDLQAEQFRNKKCIKDSEILEAFKESQDRVISMALIHEELYKGGGFETLNFSPYIEELVNNLLHTYCIGNNNTSLKLNLAKNIFLDMDTAVPLGMIVNELVTNSLKHAFPSRCEGEIKIKLYREESGKYEIEGDESTSFVLTISDNGTGIPEDLDIENLDSLGLRLVTTLVDQLDGELELKRDNGTEFIIRFKVIENDNQLVDNE